MRKTFSSRRISSAMASRSASRTVSVAVGPAYSAPRRRGGAWARRRGASRRLGGFASATCGSGAGVAGRGAGLASALAARAGILAFAGDQRDRQVDRDVLGAFGHQDLGEGAFVDRLHLHRRLVGLDLGEDVAGLDRVARLLEPLGDLAFGHGRRQRRHQHFNRHRFRFLRPRRRRRSTAPPDRAPGSAARNPRRR